MKQEKTCFLTESMPSVDNLIQMLHAYSHSEDPEHISKEMNAAQTAQASQKSCSLTHRGLSWETTGNELFAAGNPASLNLALVP